MLEQVTLEGRHVRLEPVAHVHLDDLTIVAAEPSTWRYMIFADLSQRDDLRKWIEKASREPLIGTGLNFAQIDLASGKAVGTTSIFDISMHDRGLEIGKTWVGAPYRRSAINTEAKLLLMTHAFDTMGMLRVQWKADTRNEASLRAIERIGATREGTLRQHRRCRDGFQRDTAIFSVIVSEWPKVRASLEAELARPR